MTTLTFVLPTLSFFIWLLGTLVLASVIHVSIHRLILGKRAS